MAESFQFGIGPMKKRGVSGALTFGGLQAGNGIVFGTFKEFGFADIEIGLALPIGLGRFIGCFSGGVQGGLVDLTQVVFEYRGRPTLICRSARRLFSELACCSTIVIGFA